MTGKKSGIETQECVISYLNSIFKASTDRKTVICYRGQANSKWQLKPSVMRGLKPDAENQIFSELMVEAPVEFGSDKTMFDKLVRAQHYGLPTRLVDVTLNPLVALYFACCEEEQNDQDGVVQAFDFSNDRVKFADSDTISILCNLARLSDSERKKISDQYYEEKPRTDYQIDNFRDMPEIKRLMQFVRVEKSYFLDKVQPSDLFKYFFVYPSKNNRRVIAQSGAFIAAGLLRYNKPENSNGFNLRNIIIPAKNKPHIIKQLDDLNINSRSMFPEIESTSEYIKKKWKK